MRLCCQIKKIAKNTVEVLRQYRMTILVVRRVFQRSGVGIRVMIGRATSAVRPSAQRVRFLLAVSVVTH